MKDLQSELSSLRTELTDAYKQIELARYSQDKHVRRSLQPKKDKIPKFQSDLLQPEVLSDKLQDSVTMLRESMVSNKKLRDTISELMAVNKGLVRDNEVLSSEN